MYILRLDVLLFLDWLRLGCGNNKTMASKISNFKFRVFVFVLLGTTELLLGFLMFLTEIQ